MSDSHGSIFFQVLPLKALALLNAMMETVDSDFSHLFQTISGPASRTSKKKKKRYKLKYESPHISFITNEVRQSISRDFCD